MPSMHQSSNYSTRRCAANPLPLAAGWCSPHRMKQSHLVSAAGWRARELCPQLIFVGGHFQDYQRLGDAAIDVLNDFTPLVERISIDEAFADVAGCTHLFGSPPEIARAVRRRVRTELGLPISIGVARTKHLAKIASQVAKPDGLVVVDPEIELDFLHDLPVELMWGVGPLTRVRLAKIGVHTIGELAKMPGWSLERIVGRAAGEKPLLTQSGHSPNSSLTPPVY
jgi:DNA polymerase IV